MTHIQQLNRDFLIAQLQRATYAHTSVIRYLRTHQGMSTDDRIGLKHDIKHYRYIAEGAIQGLRSIG